MLVVVFILLNGMKKLVLYLSFRRSPYKYNIFSFKLASYECFDVGLKIRGALRGAL